MNRLEDFPSRGTDKLRYGDTDRQGHVNNAVFATFMETGRSELFDRLGFDGNRSQLTFVIARLTIDFRREILWPGTVACGTAVTRTGNSSITLTQALFQNDVLVATGESVVVQIDKISHRAVTLDAKMRADLQAFILPV